MRVFALERGGAGGGLLWAAAGGVLETPLSVVAVWSVVPDVHVFVDGPAVSVVVPVSVAPVLVGLLVGGGAVPMGGWTGGRPLFDRVTGIVQMFSNEGFVLQYSPVIRLESTKICMGQPIPYKCEGVVV